MLYNILLPDSKLVNPTYGFVDVRDVAAGLVAALKQTKSSRNLLSSEHFDVTEAVDLVAKERPELKHRLPKLVNSNQEAALDPTIAANRLGITLTKWQKTVLDTVDQLLEIEKDWAAQGIDVDLVLGKSGYRA